jgi:hypothetical protein
MKKATAVGGFVFRMGERIRQWFEYYAIAISSSIGFCYLRFRRLAIVTTNSMNCSAASISQDLASND